MSANIHTFTDATEAMIFASNHNAECTKTDIAPGYSIWTVVIYGDPS
jgi:hypothetical protein